MIKNAWLIVLLLASLAGCRTTYPEACDLSTRDGVRAWRCNCRQVKVSISGGPAPAGVLTWKCDGEDLPIVIESQDVGVPQCRIK